MIIEARATAEEATTSGMGLVISSKAGKNFYCLYDASSFLSSIDHVNDLANENELSFDDLVSWIQPTVIAMILTRKPATGNSWGAREVINSAAQKGYGPLIYDIAMAFEGGLIPDRTEVSNDALNVWAKYQQRPDVIKRDLDDIDNPKTPTTEDDALMNKRFKLAYGKFKTLNSAYFIQNFPNVYQLVKNHEKAAKLVKTEWKLSAAFYDASMSFFQRRYNR